MTKTPKGFEKVGAICVDTGTILIADPCKAGEAGEDFFEAAIDENDQNYKDGVWALPLNEHGEAALAIQSGIGDGFYPVFARYEDVGGFGRRIAEIRIVFLPHPSGHRE